MTQVSEFDTKHLDAYKQHDVFSTKDKADEISFILKFLNVNVISEVKIKEAERYYTC